MYTRVYGSLSEALWAFHKLGELLGLPHVMYGYEVPNLNESGNVLEKHISVEHWDDRDQNKVHWDFLFERPVWAGFGPQPPLMISEVTITGQVFSGLCAELFPRGRWERKFSALPTSTDFRPGPGITYFFVPKDYEMEVYSGNVPANAEIDLKWYFKTGQTIVVPAFGSD